MPGPVLRAGPEAAHATCFSLEAGMRIRPIFRVWRLSPVCLKDTLVEPVSLTAMSPAAEGLTESQGNLSKQRIDGRGHWRGDWGQREGGEMGAPSEHILPLWCRALPGRKERGSKWVTSLSLSFLI